MGGKKVYQCKKHKFEPYEWNRNKNPANSNDIFSQHSDLDKRYLEIPTLKSPQPNSLSSVCTGDISFPTSNVECAWVCTDVHLHSCSNWLTEKITVSVIFLL